MKCFLFWLTQLTWGLPINLLGIFVSIFCLCKGIHPKRFGYALYFEIGEKWGGVNFGGFFFIQKNGSNQLKSHEYGHSFQTLLLGPFTPFIILIPSATRYHYRNYKANKGISLPPYDAFWCEGWATSLGHKYSPQDAKKTI